MFSKARALQGTNSPDSSVESNILYTLLKKAPLLFCMIFTLSQHKA